ncbi:hypothetical protein HRbin22_01164 [Candidatus Thermoflexus japonica]|uniref:AraC-type arabinose-binding/dimerisation domain-containing protein n=1 Tax=Candidatus Thermoflexus japonica TaxID=2035417 RepID=A0A2H5Y6F5_9CHLR|nr:hypothetical protein HRbin22_01164 [Candidatus Thermoflexus japonica]
MPIRVQAEKMLHHVGAGWQEIVLANLDGLNIPGVRLSQWKLDPEKMGPEQYHGNAEGFLYVSRGSGTIWVNECPWPLAPETVVWLEPGDRYRIQAGSEGIEILHAVVE